MGTSNGGSPCHRSVVSDCVFFSSLPPTLALAQTDLAQGFRDPPAQAKPQTWWHWMNGNITREGITADLEAMKQIGLGGAQIFNVSESIPSWTDLVHEL